MTQGIAPRIATILAAAAAFAAPPAFALDVVLTNDDGFESSTTYALYQRLVAAGHRVLISASVADQSGRGGSVDFLRPVLPLSAPSRAGCAKAGAPGVGNLGLGASFVDTANCPSDANVFWVAGTPVASALHGIDVAAAAVFGKPADLVISGPNFGNNTGLVNNASGTVNAALVALNRGIPAIAVSGPDSTYRSFKDLKDGDKEYEIADVVVRLVAALDGHPSRRAHDAPLLPAGLGLNVNLPPFERGAGAALSFRLSRVGTAASVTPVFSADLCADPLAGALLGATCRATPRPKLAGVSVVPYGAPIPPGLASLPDTDPRSEQNVIAGGAVAISVIEGNHDAPRGQAESAVRALRPLLERSPRKGE